MSDVATREGSNGDNSDRTTCRELYRFFVDFSQVGIERTRHRVFRRDLVHTVRHDSQSIGIRSHVGKEHKHLLVFLYSEIFGSSKRHIRNEKTLYRRIFGSIHKRNDAVEHTSIVKYIFEIEVVVVSKTHTTKDNFVGFGTEGHVSHNLVVRLVRVGKERNFLTRHESVVQVDTSDTSSDEFRWLFTAHRVHRRTTNFYLFAFDFWTAIDRFAKSVEETASELVANFERWGFAEEDNFGVSRDTFSTTKHLESDIIAHNAHYLSQFAIYCSKLVITNTRCFE